jgi:lipopolysaccharide/colanic/teichoic acid biosynthesis glycosyltransferase
LQRTEHPGYQQVIPARVDQPIAPESARSIDERRGYALAKRAIDVVAAILLLVILSPVLLVAAIAIMLSSDGPVLYSQVRIGRHGVPFRCWKLRTMVPSAEGLLETDGELASRYAENHKIERDPRITRVGRILRKTSIDELPQLWNVLLGDMSMVGPRPVTRSEFETKYGQYGYVVFAVRPGLTGLWQVSGRSEIPYPRRIELDLDYVLNLSLRRDLWIILLTPLAILRGGM